MSLFKRKQRRTNKASLYCCVLLIDNIKSSQKHKDLFTGLSKLLPGYESDEKGNQESFDDFESKLKNYFTDEENFYNYHVKNLNGVPTIFLAFYKEPGKNKEILKQVSYFDFTALPS